jgi:hypothetical protein
MTSLMVAELPKHAGKVARRGKGDNRRLRPFCMAQECPVSREAVGGRRTRLPRASRHVNACHSSWRTALPARLRHASSRRRAWLAFPRGAWCGYGRVPHCSLTRLAGNQAGGSPSRSTVKLAPGVTMGMAIGAQMAQPFMGRPVPRQLLRNALLDLTI